MKYIGPMTQIELVAEFIKLMQDNKVKSLKAGDISLELSDYFFAGQLVEEAEVGLKTEEKNSNRTLVDEVDRKDDDEMLFWSTRPGT